MAAGEEGSVDYEFASTAFPGEVLPVGGVRLVEALNEPYQLRVAVAFRDPDADVSLLLGQDGLLDLIRDEERSRRVCGVVRTVTEGERTHDAPIAELEIVPALWFLSQRRNTRIFQEKTVQEILQTVLEEGLGAYGREVQDELAGTYPVREMCVQYQETDLDFVHRLMEEEGISYCFEHEGEVEVIVLRDQNESFPELSSGARVPYEPQNLEIDGPEPIARFERKHRPRTSSVVVDDWDWTRGGDMVLSAEERSEGPDERDREAYEHGRGRSLTISSYDQGVRRYQEEDSAGQARIRQQAHGWDAVMGQATSRVLAAAPGATFELAGHPTVGMDGLYLITRVEHYSEPLGNLVPGGGSGDPYCNRFECIPLETPYRPERRTRRPSIASIQTAVVTGPAGEEIHVDEHGRIRIQLHWDREGANDENSTCWVRVQQPWAGPGWGFWWVPRMGMEVVVHFVNGDPDRPLVTASVYNGTNPTPYGLPDEKTKSTIKSNSSLGGGGFNEFRFEDKAGSEEIYTHAQKDYNEVVENDHDTLVHHDQTNTVHNDQTQLVKRHQTEQVDVDQTMTIGHDRTVLVKGDFDETVDGTETRHTTGDVTETFDANEARDIGTNVTESITGNEKRDITGNQDETIMASHTVTVSGSSEESVTGSWSRTVTGGITTTTPATFDITAVGGFTAIAAAGIRFIAPGGMKMIGAGGVTRVDSQWNWLGGSDVKVGLIAIGATGAQIEVVGQAVGLTGLNVSDNGLSIQTKALELANIGASADDKTVYLKTMTAVNLDAHFGIKA